MEHLEAALLGAHRDLPPEEVRISGSPFEIFEKSVEPSESPLPILGTRRNGFIRPALRRVLGNGRVLSVEPWGRRRLSRERPSAPPSLTVDGEVFPQIDPQWCRSPLYGSASGGRPPDPRHAPREATGPDKPAGSLLGVVLEGGFRPQPAWAASPFAPCRLRPSPGRPLTGPVIPAKAPSINSSSPISKPSSAYGKFDSNDDTASGEPSGIPLSSLTWIADSSNPVSLG
jgi:hypothetical protein